MHFLSTGGDASLGQWHFVIYVLYSISLFLDKTRLSHKVRKATHIEAVNGGLGLKSLGYVYDQCQIFEIVKFIL